MSRRIGAVLALVLLSSSMAPACPTRTRHGRKAHAGHKIAAIQAGGPGYSLHLSAATLEERAPDGPCPGAAAQIVCPPRATAAPVLLDPRTDVYVEAPCQPPRCPGERHDHAIAGPPVQRCDVRAACPPVANSDGTFYTHPSFPHRPLYWNQRLQQWGYRDDRSPTGWFVVPLEANVPAPAR